MIAKSLTLVALLSLTACAALRSDPAPTCDGRHRRPANPYGSVLTRPASSQPSQTGAQTPTSASFPSCP